MVVFVFPVVSSREIDFWHACVGQTLQTAAMRALSSILYGLLHYYPEDEFAAPDLPGVEPFIDKKGRPLGTPPKWHNPSADEVRAALFSTFSASSPDVTSATAHSLHGHLNLDTCF